MSSFRIKIDPKQRASARFIGDVRLELQRMLLKQEGAGLNKAEIAKRLGIHRSAVTRRLNGTDALSLRTVAELVWAMGGEPAFHRVEPNLPVGSNHPAHQVTAITASNPINPHVKMKEASSSSSGTAAASSYFVSVG